MTNVDGAILYIGGVYMGYGVHALTVVATSDAPVTWWTALHLISSIFMVAVALSP